MKKLFLMLIMSIIVGFAQQNNIFALEPPSPTFRISSSPNPVGSGARALGWGGAFIAVADDATAASWNPGGLVQLKRPEISIVGNWSYLSEDNTFGANPEANGKQSVSKENLNYLSITYPFFIFNRPMVVSLNYQHLYDFGRKWENLSFRHEVIDDETGENWAISELIDYQQKGRLSAIGIAYGINIIPEKIYFGFSLNFWDDDLCNNEWEEDTHVNDLLTPEGNLNPSIVNTLNITDRYAFSGFNFNVGALFRATEKLTVGLVFKSPFTADLKREATWTQHIEYLEYDIDQLKPGSYTSNEKMDMPMSYGIGLAYRFSDKFTLSADIYRTEWDDYSITDSDGNETSPLTGKSLSESDIDPTTQIRVGVEYLFINPGSIYDYALRGGIFHDPGPAVGSPDDYYGFSLGAGIGIKSSSFGIKKYIVDVSYQYRFGDDVGSLMNLEYDFSEDVKEHMVYASLIVHF